MRLLLAQKSPYVPCHGGANKANRYILETLAARGHECKAVVPMRAMHNPGDPTGLDEHLRVRGISFSKSDADLTFNVGGVQVSAVKENSALGNLRSEALCNRLRSEIDEFCPDVVLIASEDQHQFLLKAAVSAALGRIVYIARSSSMLGFGPLCFFPNAHAVGLIKEASRVISNSEYLRKYIHKWAGVDSYVMDFQTYGKGPFPDFGSKATGNITMVNPCAVKGIHIFLELAKSLPDLPFAAISGWGTTPRDLLDLSKLSNVVVSGPFDNVDDIFRDARILLVPSLWDESFGRIVVEAMLRGIPVLASNIGGLPEATLGAGVLLPVAPIVKFRQRFDENYIPEADIPSQDIRPWLQTLQEMITNPSLYRQFSARSRTAATAYMATLSFDPFEDLIMSTTASNKQRGTRG